MSTPYCAECGFMNHNVIDYADPNGILCAALLKDSYEMVLVDTHGRLTASNCVTISSNSRVIQRKLGRVPH